MKKTIKFFSIGVLVPAILAFVALSLNYFVKFSEETLLFSTIYLSVVMILSLFTFISMGIYQKKKFNQLELKANKITFDLTEYQSLFSALFNHAYSGVALLKLDGYFIKANESLLELLGYHQRDISSVNFYHLTSADDLANLEISIQQLLGHQIKFYQAEQKCYRKSGDVIWVLATISLISNTNHQPNYFILQVQDVTMQRKAEERLMHMAYHDPLTGLANRNQLEQFINHILASSKRYHQGFALMFLDLDRFKNINDTIGHDAGDQLLQIFAERLKHAVRNTDMVARLGGDEFVLLITDVKQTESMGLLAQKILDCVLQPTILNGKEIYMTTSIGISTYPHDGSSLQKLMKNADLALYRAKEQGRNNYQFYTVEMTAKVKQKMEMQNALAHALVKDEFLLHYQPKMDIKKRKVTGIEALLRWNNTDFNMIAPHDIIELAEETGLIIPLSDFVLKTACSQLNKWHAMGFDSIKIAVNCSARQFKQATFVDDLLKMLSDINFQPSMLQLEITESIIMQDFDNTLRVLYGLKDLGISISIDDFGTGYWSLGNLRNFSVDEIKIDKTFIKHINTNETSAAIVSAIIGMANRLGIKTVAEGVETKIQYEWLEKEKCTEIQGYYLTQPLTDEAMTHFLQHPIPDAENIRHIETSI